MLLIVLILNIGISFWNARVVGLMWPERKVHGTFIYLVILSAVVQSVLGFSLPILLLELWVATSAHYVSPAFMEAAIRGWYVFAILPLLGTGLIITAHSWIAAYRERSFGNMATATYNTVAQAHNMYSAVSGIGDAFKGLGGFFSSDDEDASAKGALLMIALVALSVLGGAFITYGIIRHYAGRLSLPNRATASA
jgi:hypothetical protein